MDKNNFMGFLDFPNRPKPHDEGITSMHDMFLPLKEIEDFLEVASEFIDSAKLIHIGLFQSLPEGWLEKKLQIYKDKGVKVYPGGVPFQVAIVQNKVKDYFNWVAGQGFDAVEIADDAMVSTIELAKRTEAIKMALDKGLEVHTELGKKHPDKPLQLDEAYKTIQRDLDLGVSLVVIERAELDPFIKGDSSPLLTLVEKVGLKHLLFEPGPFGWPHVHHWCLKTFGPNVNLGNIEKNEVIYIEYSRRGISRFVDYNYFVQYKKYK